MKKIIPLIFLLFFSCQKNKLNLEKLDFKIISNKDKIEYYEIENYENLNNEELSKIIIQFINFNIKRDSINKYNNYQIYFYKKKWFNNYNCKFDRYYNNSDNPRISDMDMYLKLFLLFSKVNNSETNLDLILYEKKKIVFRKKMILIK